MFSHLAPGVSSSTNSPHSPDITYNVLRIILGQVKLSEILVGKCLVPLVVKVWLIRKAKNSGEWILKSQNINHAEVFKYLVIHDNSSYKSNFLLALIWVRKSNISVQSLLLNEQHVYFMFESASSCILSWSNVANKIPSLKW